MLLYPFACILLVLPLYFQKATRVEKGHKAREGYQHSTNIVSLLVCALLMLGEIVLWYSDKGSYTSHDSIIQQGIGPLFLVGNSSSLLVHCITSILLYHFLFFCCTFNLTVFAKKNFPQIYHMQPQLCTIYAFCYYHIILLI